MLLRRNGYYPPGAPQIDAVRQHDSGIKVTAFLPFPLTLWHARQKTSKNANAVRNTDAGTGRKDIAGPAWAV